MSDDTTAQALAEFIAPELDRHYHTLHDASGAMARAVLDSGLVVPAAWQRVAEDAQRVLAERDATIAAIGAELARIDSDGACIGACVNIGRILHGGTP